jgi:hypothetical protein
MPHRERAAAAQSGFAPLLNSVVLSVNVQEQDPESITWVLDSGSQVNICTDLSAFEEIVYTEPHTLFMANGSQEVVTQIGKVAMMVMNEVPQLVEEKLLEGVYYSPKSSARHHLDGLPSVCWV